MTEEQAATGAAHALYPTAEWENPCLAYVQCPGMELHTNSNGRRDCRLTINDGMPPTIFCCHNSCRGAVEDANHTLRSLIGKMKVATAGQLSRNRFSASKPADRGERLKEVVPVSTKKPLAPMPLPAPLEAGRSRHLNHAFNPEELVGIVFGSGPDGKPQDRGQTFRLDAVNIDHPNGTYVRVNPMRQNGSGDNDVAAYRHCLIECDSADKETQYAAIIASNLPVSVAVDSGRRSVHAWVRVDASTPEEFRERAKMAADAMEEWEGIQVDRSTLNPSRLARLAGCRRGNTVQELLAVNLGADCWDDWLAGRKSKEPEKELVSSPVQAPQRRSEFFYRKQKKDFLLWRPDGAVIPLNKEDLKMMLKFEGWVDDGDRNGMEAAIADIMLEKGLDYDGSMPGYRKGLHIERGHRYFCDAEPEWIEGVQHPDAEKGTGWENIHKLIFQMLAPIGRNGHPNTAVVFHFLSTLKQSRDALKVALRPLADGEHRSVRPGPATVLCGPKNCGKSFLVNAVISRVLGGRLQDAHKAFSGGSDGFNGELLNGEVWVVDDKEHASDIRARRQFGANIKSMLYSGSVGFHPKHKTQITLRPFARLFILCNDQDEAIRVLPPLTADLDDKIHLFRCNAGLPPMATSSNDDWSAYERQIIAEIPAFCGFLDSYKISDKFKDSRNGVKCWHDPYVVGLLASQTPEWQLAGLIAHAIEEKVLPAKWDANTREIMERLRADEGIEPQLRNLVHNDAAVMGRYLRRIAEDGTRYKATMGLCIKDGGMRGHSVFWSIISEAPENGA